MPRHHISSERDALYGLQVWKALVYSHHLYVRISHLSSLRPVILTLGMIDLPNGTSFQSSTSLLVP